MNVYAESSAVLSWLLGEPSSERVRNILEEADIVYTSDLTLVECDRTLLRYEQEQRLPEVVIAERSAALEELRRDCSVLRLGDEVIARARRRFPDEPVRSLDALHLASALVASRASADVAMLTLDDRIRRVSTGLGFEVLPN